MNSESLSAATALHADMLVWDQHGCLPLHGDENAIEELCRYARAGVDVVSVGIGLDAAPPLEAVHTLATFRRALRSRSDSFTLASTVADIHTAKRSGRLAVSFDIEGMMVLGGEVSMVETFYDLGVRTMLVAYNQDNSAGGGCHGDPSSRLTSFGREIVREMNRVGMVVDASHCSLRTTMDLFEVSEAPVIFSHSAPRGVCEHPRNVSDEQIRACAETGGVIGIIGIGIFLGDRTASTDSVARAIDYTVNLVGPNHVGIGFDYCFDQADLDAAVAAHPEIYPAGYGYTEFGSLQIAAPEQAPALTERLLELGYDEDAVRGIMGGNFLRVASQVWGGHAACDSGRVRGA